MGSRLTKCMSQKNVKKEMTKEERKNGFEDGILKLQEKFNVEIYAANAVLWKEGEQEVLPVIKFKFN